VDIRRPLTRRDRLAPSAAAAYVKPNDRLTSRQRLEIYSRSYWYRLMDSLYDDFAGLRMVLGQRAFGRLIRAYLIDCPSRSFTMRDLGSRLDTWLRRNPQHAGDQFPVALDMIRLEWAHIEAWDGPAEAALCYDDLAEVGPDLRIGLQPHIRLLDLQYQVDELRLRINSTAEPSAKIAKPRWRMPEPRFLVVHRLNLSVFYKRVSPEEFRILRAIRDGKTIGEALEQGIAETSIDPGLVGSWFSAWAEFGWFI